MKLSPTFILVFLCLSFHQRILADDISFTRDIRPILSNKCYKCHGPDDDARVSEMRLDTETGLFHTDYAPIARGNLKKSAIVERILSDDPDIRMPPTSANKDLTAQEIRLLQQWVKRGAKWEPHWAFQKPHDNTPPGPRKRQWRKNTIDDYITNRLAITDSLHRKQPIHTL